MKEIKVEDKQKYLDENYPFVDTPKLTDIKECIHCNNIIIVGEFRVFKDEVGEEYICCPHAPECNGTVIDWITVDNK